MRYVDGTLGYVVGTLVYVGGMSGVLWGLMMLLMTDDVTQPPARARIWRASRALIIVFYIYQRKVVMAAFRGRLNVKTLKLQNLYHNKPHSRYGSTVCKCPISSQTIKYRYKFKSNQKKIS